MAALVPQRNKHDHHHHHSNSSSSTNNNPTMLLLMLLDGVGLAVIAGCTIVEGMELWTNYFREYVQPMNHPALAFWVCGRVSQVSGLLLLITYAASSAIGILVHELEQMGMLLLTLGPVLNLCACSVFDSQADPSYAFNRQWLCSEALELTGIALLDLSMLDVADHVVLFFEVVGFFVLDYDGEGGNGGLKGGAGPEVSLRLDLVHVTDAAGLLMLTCVACAQYRTKTAAARARGPAALAPPPQQHGAGKWHGGADVEAAVAAAAGPTEALLFAAADGDVVAPRLRTHGHND
jgi:hypothetical protein